MSLKQFLQSKFNEKDFTQFISKAFPYFEENIEDFQSIANDNYINAYKFLGTTTLDDERNIGFFIIHVKDGINIENVRVGLNEHLKKIASDELLEGAIASFYIPQNPQVWRMSFLRFSYDDENREQATNLKRYTYVLGQNIPIKTAHEQLQLLNKPKSLDVLQDIFSVEKVSKEFYRGLIGQYENLLKTHLVYPSDDENNKKEFAIRLLGRILFIKFLNKKNFVPDEIFEVCDDYYHEILEPLFFEQLNTPKDERKEEFSNESIPFLNGGLFEPLGLDCYRYINGCSEYINTLKVDNTFFQDLYEHLNQFNFTIDENSSDDNELSIDPEMLGRVFENLLAEINPESKENARKATGSYYTPREIVDYMVSSSLLEHLKTKTDINEDILKCIIFKNEEPKLDYEKTKILTALFELKILDPACGSGAFPMGLLQKIVKILTLIDEDATIWFELQSEEFRNAHKHRNKDYIRKLSIIKNTIYGVDIQPIAMEISKLRFFLSLIVEEEGEPEPLPNLEFKFVCANSLLSMPKLLSKPNRMETGNIFFGQDTIYGKNEDKLIKLKNEYFEAVGKRKDEIKKEYKAAQDILFKTLEEYYTKDKENKKLHPLENDFLNYNPFDPLSQAKFFDSDFMFNIKDGFDIVIGNPPYVRHEKIKEQKPKLEKDGYKSYCGTADLYIYFFEKGYNLLKENGILSYITSNKYTRAKYGQNFREFVLQNCSICEYLDFNGVKVFESATVDTSILNFKKSQSQKEYFLYCNIDNSYIKNSSLDEFVFKNRIDYKTSDLTDESFVFLNPIELSIKKKIEAIGTPLKDWDISINYGIKTGYNKAFIINTEKKDEILDNCKTEDERKRTEQIIRPILRGRDIKRYSYKWADLWLINTHNGYKDGAEKIPPIDIDNYPALKNYLDLHIEKLTNREDQGITPYNLRNCAYMRDFDRQKIVYSEIVRNSQFYLDSDSFFCEATSFILVGDNLKYLIAMLNSKLMTFSFKMFYAGGGLGSDGFRYKKAFLENLPIPKIPKEKEKILISNVVEILKIKKLGISNNNKLEDDIDSLIYSFFGINNKEIDYIEDS